MNNYWREKTLSSEVIRKNMTKKKNKEKSNKQTNNNNYNNNSNKNENGFDFRLSFFF